MKKFWGEALCFFGSHKWDVIGWTGSGNPVTQCIRCKTIRDEFWGRWG